jgi:hypothetical protein
LPAGRLRGVDCVKGVAPDNPVGSGGLPSSLGASTGNIMPRTESGDRQVNRAWGLRRRRGGAAGRLPSPSRIGETCLGRGSVDSSQRSRNRRRWRRREGARGRGFAFRSFCIRPLETIGSLIARASISPLWRVEGAGIARSSPSPNRNPSTPNRSPAHNRAGSSRSHAMSGGKQRSSRA